MKFESEILKELEIDSLISVKIEKDSEITKDFELYSKIDFEEGNHE